MSQHISREKMKTMGDMTLVSILCLKQLVFIVDWLNAGLAHAAVQ